MRIPTALRLRLAGVLAALAATCAAQAKTDIQIQQYLPTQASDYSLDNDYASNSAGTDFAINQYSGSDVLTGVSFSTSALRPPALVLNLQAGSRADARWDMRLDIAGVALSSVSKSPTAALMSSGGNQLNLDHINLSGSITAADALSQFVGSASVAGTITHTLGVNLLQGSAATLSNRLNFIKPFVDLTYGYITAAHALGSFAQGASVLDLDFGSIASGSLAQLQTFDLYNALGAYGLQVLSASQVSGDANVFSLAGLSEVSQLAGGTSTQGTASMAAQAVDRTTSYAGQWKIIVADSALGDGANKNLTGTNELFLNLSATVLAPVAVALPPLAALLAAPIQAPMQATLQNTLPARYMSLQAPITPVPEPASCALMLAGLGALAWIGSTRRCKPQLRARPAAPASSLVVRDVALAGSVSTAASDSRMGQSGRSSPRQHWTRCCSVAFMASSSRALSSRA
jgi:hypothetical protein